MVMLDLTKQDKIEFIYKNIDKNKKRKIAKISTGQYLIMEKTNRIENFVKEKIDKMNENDIDRLYKKCKRE